jgi:uncharacterized protein (UPF0212 family)
MKTTETKSAKHLLGAFVQKAGKRLRKDIDLVHVIWGPDDQGVVSLKLGTWLFYNFGREFGGHHSRLPTVYIEDADFALVLKPVEGDPDCIEATWDDVARLLNHPRFPLVKRIEWPVVEKCKRCGANLTGTQEPENPPNNRPYGLCSDPTCPYNDRSQEATWTEG